MPQDISMHIIARAHSDFPTKFGIPRQSGLVQELRSTIIFEPEYRDENALRGLEGFSHLWLIWQFSEAVRSTWSPTVRPPRLGGNERMGVFATRSPFRPNAIGLSCVKIESIELSTPEGPLVHVLGADLMDKTPILDIKPYVPYADAHPEALAGFAPPPQSELEVVFPENLLERLPEDKRSAAIAVLAQNPIPRYKRQPGRVYGLSFAGFDLRFSIEGTCLQVVGVEREAK